ncbi:MAG: sigma-70 family RNA polymerase sigma factor, partial [Egibacteraceae bacterium]
MRRRSTEDHDETDIDQLIERSSFGGAAARQLQSRTSPEVRASIRARVEEQRTTTERVEESPVDAHDDVDDLVRAAAEGDESAWDQLVERFNGLVWAVARGHRLSDADAADVAQATWLRLVEHIDRVRDPERLGDWLATTARRECLRLLRRAGRVQPTRRLPDLPIPEEAGTGPEFVAL